MKRDAIGRFVDGGFKDYTGIKKNRLTFVSLDHIHHTPAGKKIPYWLVKCDCGNEIVRSSKDIMSQHTLSCGCLQKEKASEAQKTHGQSQTRLYRTWENMKKRCYKEYSSRYQEYGARGITVCDEWRNSFEAFYKWAYANGYDDLMTIDRIDVNGNYEPSNCRWVISKDQAMNKRSNHIISLNGVDYSATELSELYSIPIKTIYARISRGDTGERIVRPLTVR